MFFTRLSLGLSTLPMFGLVCHITSIGLRRLICVFWHSLSSIKACAWLKFALAWLGLSSMFIVDLKLAWLVFVV